MGKKQLTEFKVYNEDFKERFLNLYEKESTNRLYRYMFRVAGALEVRLKKDIYEMNNSELDLLLKSYNSGSIQAIAGIIAVLKSYISFAIEQGYTDTEINYLQLKNSYEDFTDYLNNNKIINRIVTKNELTNICNQCENAQDAVCFALPFYGIKGEANSEILDLKITDIDDKNYTVIVEKRIVKADEFLIDLIKEAYSETEYKSLNGLSTRKGHTFKDKSEYVIKSAGKTPRPLAMTVNLRIKRVGLNIGNGKLTPNTIWYSGYYNSFKELLKGYDTEDKKIDKIIKDTIIKLTYRFGYKEEYYWKLKKRFEDYDKLIEV